MLLAETNHTKHCITLHLSSSALGCTHLLLADAAAGP